MCVSVLIVCLENKRGHEVFVVKIFNNFVSSGCFKKVFFHHKDSLASRTLFVIPHNFFMRNNAFIFFQKSDTLFLYKPGPCLN